MGLLIFAFVNSSAVFASDIPPAYRQVAVANRIPPDIFYAIALAESGRDLGASGPVRPWPWTLNIHGEGVFFVDRRSAWRVLAASIANQRTSVDIGLMQVSWRYHGRRLLDPWRALDPHVNLQVAAEILRNCQERLTDWWLAVGCYHAPSDPERAARYRQRVLARWQSLAGS